MPYKIPTDIRYEEKLFGPLTVRQSVIAAIVGGIIGYVAFFSNLPPTLQVFIIIVVGALGGGFIWFNLERHLVNYISFMGEKKSTSWISPAAKRLMNVKGIRADSVFLKEDILAVIKIRPINFGLLSKDDQDTVIYGFLQFLNSLDFPIQIVMRSINLDLSDYLNALKRRILQRNDKISLAYYEHFSEYMYDYIKKNKISDRLFYIVIPVHRYWGERETIRRLERRGRVVIEALSRSGIVAERLDDKQLLSLYSSYFTQTFNVDEEFLSPITFYRKMWKETPGPVTVEEVS